MKNKYAEDFRFLNRSMLENNLVVFVGAGVSTGSGLPSWNKLLEDIQNRLGIKDNSFADNTIVPQLYYNSRGKKDYNELIHDLFYIPNLQPNDIHKCLVKINPRYIITTNYDNLLEQAFNDSSIFLDVIEKDSDFPYARTEHMLIKMHGGFKYNNFVLKEDDYLNYTKNFTLTENYIKALFARYTVLFVGYSFNDPDTKQIFSWVRNILREDQQRAYLLNVSDDFDSQTYEYYKNIGINVIYAKSIIDNSDDLTQSTVSVLNKIIVPQYNILSEINEIFKGYDVFNYISGDYIQSIFNNYFTCTFDNECLTFHCQTESEFSSAILYFDKSDIESTKKIQSEYPFIIKIIRKSLIKKIMFIKIYENLKSDRRIEYIISDSITLKDISPFEEFDYISVQSGTMPHTSDEEDNYLQKAYCYYFLKDYLSCYDLLRKAAQYYLSTNQLEMYLITENNRIDVGKILSNNLYIKISLDQRNKIKSELNKIETEGIYANIYPKIKHNSLVSELIDFRYIYKNLYRIIDKGRKVDEEARTQYYMYAGKTAYERIEYIAQDLYNYMQYNYLLLDVYSETKCIYTVFIEYLLLSLSKKRETTDGNFFESTYNIALDKLSRFDVMIILRFLTFKEIKNIVSKYNIDKIVFNEDVFSYLLNVIKNLNDAYKYKFIPNSELSIYSKIFHILKIADLSEDLLTPIFDTVKELLKEYNDNLDYNEINSFITKQYKNKKYIFSIDEIEYLIILICNNASYNQVANSNSGYIRILKNLADIMYEIDPNRKIEIDDRSIIIFSTCISESALISLYTVSNEKFQDYIKKRIKAVLSEKGNSYTYYDALIHNVIQPTENYEDILYNHTKQIYNESNGISSVVDTNYIIYCANLIFEDKIINKEKFIELVKRDKSLFLLVDPENFDFKFFEPQLLSSLTSKSLEIISSNKVAHETIYKKLKKYLSNNWDEKIAKIYIRYFC